MKTFAAAALLSVASATETASDFDASRYYSYGYGAYEYPEYTHKEELTPFKPAPKDHRENSNYQTNNIDIFAHSESESDDGHGHGYAYGHYSSHDSDSSTDSSEDEKHHHPIMLTGEGDEGDHCHESQGDYCGKVDEPSDYSDSDYSTPSEESEEVFVEKPTGCGGELCARVDFDWNYLNIDGTMDIYQPYGLNPNILFDADFDNLIAAHSWTTRPYPKYEVALRNLPNLRGHWQGEDEELVYHGDHCSDTGATAAWIGTVKADQYGGSSTLRAYSDEICLEDVIGQSMEIRGRYEGDSTRDALKVLACGNVVEVPCPRRPKPYSFFHGLNVHN